MLPTQQPSAFGRLRMLQTVATATVLGLCAFLGASAQAAEVTATNGLLTIEYEDTTGEFTIKTGANHPNPFQNVFYPTGTSYITVRDYTRGAIWTNPTDFGGGPSSTDPATGISRQTLTVASTTPLGNTGFRTIMNGTGFRVQQDVFLAGATIFDTHVRHEVSVINTGGSAMQFGLRYLWDWKIARSDDSISRTRFPDSVYTSTFSAFDAPAFQFYEQTDSLSSPTFTIYGSVRGGNLPAPPTVPERVAYVSWSDFYAAPWDTVIQGGGDDSAILYYWGYRTPISLAAGATQTFRQYVSTVASGIGVVERERTMVEYRNAQFDYFFMTSRDSEKELLDRTAGWARTGQSFVVLSNNDPGTRGITRYFYAQVARNRARGSHFYTLVPSEKESLRGLNPTNATTPRLPYNEDIDSYAILTDNDGAGQTCPSGRVPVYRIFRGNARFPDDPNHRFTTSLTTYNQLVAAGWDGEGVKFCAVR